jgi:DNA-binding CsgD family transcriptional regulator
MKTKVIEDEIELIDSVYAATTAEGTLYGAVRMFLGFQGDVGGSFFYYDSINGEASDIEVVTLSDDFSNAVQGVFDVYTKKNGNLKNPIIAEGLGDLMAGKILISDDVIPFSRFKKTGFYKEVYEPLGIRRSMGWIATGRGQQRLTFTSSREAKSGRYSTEHLQRAKLFQKHMARAMHILELLEGVKAAKNIFEISINNLPQGILLVNDSCEVVFPNKAATKLISESRSLSMAGKTLRVGSTAHDRAKFSHWWKILVSTHSSDGACFNDAPLDRVWEIDVSRLASTSGSKGKTNDRMWMITFKEHPSEDPLPSKYLEQRFGLTKAEALVCTNLCCNGDAVSTAKAMGLSPNTVRVHLKSAFRKTGTHNQVELVLKITKAN